MAVYTKHNLREVENSAPKFEMPEEMEARFARKPIEGETLGLSLFTLAPNFRIPFGHKHPNQEEVYVLVKGSARIKIEDEIVELEPWDAVRIGKDTMRNVEAGPEGAEYIAFGAGTDPRARTRCGTSRQAPREPSTSPSAPAPTRETRR
jgi:mannose-6-phosphate isomerase-like protein (cupin superfamily)